MAWAGAVFPSLPLISFPLKRSPMWSAVKQDALSGKRVRYSLFSYPLWSFEIPITGLRTASQYAEWQTFVGFINSLYGTTGLFGYTDIVDNSVTNQAFGTGNGSTKGPFGLVRTLGGFTEPVFLINGTPTVSVNGTPTAAYTIDAYGNITFTNAPANNAALTWTGSFYWPCRFDDDVIDMELFVANIYSVKSVKFSTEKLP